MSTIRHRLRINYGSLHNTVQCTALPHSREPEKKYSRNSLGRRFRIFSDEFELFKIFVIYLLISGLYSFPDFPFGIISLRIRIFGAASFALIYRLMNAVLFRRQLTRKKSIT